MTLFKRCVHGIELAIDSFNILYKEKKLIFYSLIPATGLLLGAFALIWWFALDKAYLKDLDLVILVNGLPFAPMTRYLIVIILNMFMTFIIIFANVTLIFHATQFLRQQSSTFRASFANSSSKWWIILQWAFLCMLANIISMFFVTSFEGSSPNLKTVAIIIAAAVSIAIMLALFLVLPCIALQRGSILNAVKTSLFVVRHHLAEIISGSIIISLIGFAIVLPLALVGSLAIVSSSTAFAIITAMLTMFIGAFMQTITMIFKALIYDIYYRKQTEELAVIQHEMMF